MKGYVQITTTTNSREDAERIARRLVESHLAACVQVLGPMRSIYRWKDQIERTTEWLCVAKTREDLASQVEESIVQLHSYETPEILVLPIVGGSKNYISWLERETRKRDGSCNDT